MNEANKRPDPALSHGSGSTIERAMRGLGHGLGAAPFAPPPVPSDLLPAALRPSAPSSGAPPAAPAPPVAQPVSAPAPVAAQAPVTQPPIAQPPVAQATPQPKPAPAAQAPDSTPAPPRADPKTPAPNPRRKVYPIDRQRLEDANMVRPEGGATAQLEEFRIVKRQLLEQAATLGRMGGANASRRLMVTSPYASEGKTSCALNLALSIAAEHDNEVLLVDFDLARAQVLETLGLPKGPGLMNALADPSLDVLDLVMETDIPGFSVLPGGPPTNSDSEYLAAGRAAGVLDRLTAGSPDRIVVFDTPPALAASIPAELAKLVGQVVLVVMADNTPQGAIKDAISLLSGCPNVQLLLNAVHFSPSGRRFGSYYGYRG